MWKYTDSLIISTSITPTLSANNWTLEVPENELWLIKSIESFNTSTGDRQTTTLILNDGKNTIQLKTQASATTILHEPQRPIMAFSGWKLGNYIAAAGADTKLWKTLALVDRFIKA